MTIADKLTLLASSKEALRVKLGLPKSLPFSEYYKHSYPFEPMTLFTGGKQGVWYDPSDKATLFKDAAGTVPVTKDGDPVGLMKDKSGNSNHAKQSVSTARPTYRTDGILHWLQFDGVDDSLSTPFNGILAQNTFINIGYKYDTVKSSQTLVSSGISGATEVMIGTINNTQLAVYAVAASFSAGESISLNSTVSVAWNDNGARSIRRNSDGYISGTPNQTNFTSKYPVNLGAAYNGARLMQGRIYGVLIAELTDTLLRDRLNNFTMAKSGVEL